jgi:hypothetical protein
MLKSGLKVTDYLSNINVKLYVTKLILLDNLYQDPYFIDIIRFMRIKKITIPSICE